MPKVNPWKEERKEIRKFFKKIDDPTKTPEFSYLLPDRYSQTYKAFELLSNRLIKRLLDLGSGWGSIPLYLMKKGIVEEITGIDINPGHKEKFYSNAKTLGLEDRVGYIVHDLNRGLPDLPSKYDAITAFDTLMFRVRSYYHQNAETQLLEQDIIIRELRNVTTRRGLLLIINLCDEDNCELPHDFAGQMQRVYQIFPSDFGHERNLDYIFATIY